MDNVTYSARRLRVEKLSDERPGSSFRVEELPIQTSGHADSAVKFERGAFVIPRATLVVHVTWK